LNDLTTFRKIELKMPSIIKIIENLFEFLRTLNMLKPHIKTIKKPIDFF